MDWEKIDQTDTDGRKEGRMWVQGISAFTHSKTNPKVGYIRNGNF